MKRYFEFFLPRGGERVISFYIKLVLPLDQLQFASDIQGKSISLCNKRNIKPNIEEKCNLCR